jgi:hypothetical protein
MSPAIVMHENPSEGFAVFSLFGLIDLGIFHGHLGGLDGLLDLAIIFSGFLITCAFCL